MLLRSITRHVKDQNWFAVFIDFLIVVVGVFIGIQVANWNEMNANKAGLSQALTRLDKEVTLNAEIIDQILLEGEAGKAKIDIGKTALSQCAYSAEAQQALEESLFLFVNDMQPNFVSVVLEQLSRQDHYLDLFTPGFQNDFGAYTRVLKEEHEQFTSHYNNMSSHHIHKHPSVNAHFAGDMDHWYFFLDKPFEVVCKDASFRNRFINTIGFYDSIIDRLSKSKDNIEKFQGALQKELEIH